MRHIKGGVAGKGKPEDAVAVDTKVKKVQETIVIEEGEKTLEDVIEDQRAKLHREGKKVKLKNDLVLMSTPLAMDNIVKNLLRTVWNPLSIAIDALP